MKTRRFFLKASLSVPLTRVVNAQSTLGKMQLAIHQNTSRGAGYRGSLEGWAKAGIRCVELNDGVLDGFLKTDTLPAARRVLTENGLAPVSAAANLPDLWPPGRNARPRSKSGNSAASSSPPSASKRPTPRRSRHKK